MGQAEWKRGIGQNNKKLYEDTEDQETSTIKVETSSPPEKDEQGQIKVIFKQSKERSLIK